MASLASNWPYPRWIAHRGAGKLAPENTMAAFRVGASHGYRAFECDVKLSADGVPFLLHDATLQRTSSGHGIAGALDWSALARLDAGSWHSRGYAGEPLPSLDAIAAFCLRAAQAAGPNLPRALLLDSLRTGWLDEARALGCAGVVTNYAVMDAGVLSQVHAAGMRALVYTVNDPAEVLRLVGIGIDGIITDAVDRFSPAL
jgi:glycerophosphoryl diester phosphodiesterase